MIGDALRLEVAAPRIDPDVVRRAVEHAIGARPRRDDVEQQLDEDVADRLGARGARLGRDQRARDAVAEQLLIGGRALLGADEFPPADLFVVVVRRSRHEVTICQTFEPKKRRSSWVRSRSPPRKRPRSSSITRTSVIVRGRTGDQIDGMASVAVQLAARRVDEVVGDGARRPVRDPGHRVGDVPVEAREEAKPVLARQVLAAVCAGLRYRKAPRLTPGNRQQLVDFHVEAALDQFVGRAQPRDAAAEDDDLRTQGTYSPLTSGFLKRRLGCFARRLVSFCG